MIQTNKFNILFIVLTAFFSNVLSQFFLSLPSRNVSIKNIHPSLSYKYAFRKYNTNQTFDALSFNSSKQFGVSSFVDTRNVIAPIFQNNVVGYDVNPILLSGTVGLPGIKVRINNCAFTYFSKILTPILTQQLKNARLPNINQCLPPPLQGCIQVYNLYVSRFRCPNRVILYPAPPNQIVIAVENFDIGVTGNLGGVINILLPVALTGIIQVNAHQVNIRVSLVIDRNSNGGLSIRVTNCQTSVGYLDAYIENGGLLGDIANSQFRSKISEMIRSMLPNQVCNQIPSIVNQQLNGKLTSIPQSISLTQILQTALNLFGLNNLMKQNCPSHCKKKLSLAAAPHLTSEIVLTPSTILNYTSINKNIQQKSIIHINVDVKPMNQNYNISNQSNFKNLEFQKISNNSKNFNSVLNRAIFVKPYVTQIYASKKNNSINEFFYRNKRQYPHYHIYGVAVAPSPLVNNYLKPNKPKTVINSLPNAPLPSGPGLSSGQLLFPAPGSNPCAACGNIESCDSTNEILSFIFQSLNFNKLSNIYLKIQFLNSYATNQDFIIELNGEFYNINNNNVPFGAFPIKFSQQFQSKMAEILISDYTINTLFYHLQKADFITIKIDSKTPKIGDLLKTTCSTDDELEDHGVEIDEINTSTLDTDIVTFKNLRRKIRNANNKTFFLHHHTLNRQKREESLADLGICLGDILPNIRDKYPNKKVYIQIVSQRAPSVILSNRNGGTATLDIVLSANIYIQETNERVGHLEINSIIDFTVTTTEGKIAAHIDIRQLQLRDPEKTLGLSQEALDNLGNLGKELLLKAGNNLLEKGVSPEFKSIPGFPVKFSNLELKIVEHAIHLAADLSIDPSAISQLNGGGSGGC